MRSALRELLPQRRHSESFTMTFGGQRTVFTITCGFYPDGRLGEIFIDGAQIGSEVHAITHDAAVLASIGLQYGVPLETFRHAISRDRDNKAATIIGAVLDKINEMEIGK
jgi:hypothetical protein